MPPETTGSTDNPITKALQAANNPNMFASPPPSTSDNPITRALGTPNIKPPSAPNPITEALSRSSAGLAGASSSASDDGSILGGDITGRNNAWYNKPIPTMVAEAFGKEIPEFGAEHPVLRGVEQFGLGLTTPVMVGLALVTGGAGALAEGGVAAAEGGVEAAEALAAMQKTGVLDIAMTGGLGTQVSKAGIRGGAQLFEKLAAAKGVPYAEKVFQASKWASRFATAGFSGKMIYDVSQGLPQIQDRMAVYTSDKSTPQEKEQALNEGLQLATEALMASTMAGFGAVHLAKSLRGGSATNGGPTIEQWQRVQAAHDQPAQVYANRARNFEATNRALIQNPAMDMAARLWHSAGEDNAKLEDWRKIVASDTAIRPQIREKWDGLLQQAQTLPENVKQLSRSLRDPYNTMYDRLVEMGKLPAEVVDPETGEKRFPKRENYAGQMEYVPGDEHASDLKPSGIRSTKSPGFTKKAYFDDPIEALQNGYEMKDGLAASHGTYLRRFGSLEGVMAAEQQMLSLKNADGTPFAVAPGSTRVVNGKVTVALPKGFDITSARFTPTGEPKFGPAVTGEPETVARRSSPIGEWLPKAEAQKLADWWNANSKDHYELENQSMESTNDTRAKNYWRVLKTPAESPANGQAEVDDKFRPVVPEILRTHNENGGSTYNIDRGNLAGKDMYAVAIFPERTQTFDRPLTQGDISNYLRQNSDLLHDPRASFGSWTDPATGQHVLDVSATTPNRIEAEELGRRFDQKAVFNLKDFSEIPTGGTGGSKFTGDVPAEQRLSLLTHPYGEPDTLARRTKAPTPEDLIDREGTTKDIKKANWITEDGQLIPRNGIEHDIQLGGKLTDNLRELFIKHGRAIRVLWSRDRAGETGHFTIPNEGVTYKQLSYLRQAAAEVPYGNIRIETVGEQTDPSRPRAEYIEMPTGAKVEGAVRRMAGIRDEQPDEVARRGTPAGSTVPLLKKPLSIEDRPTVQKVAKALQDFTTGKSNLNALDMASSNPEEMVGRARDIGAHELYKQLGAENSGKGWYAADIDRFHQAMAQLHPELTDDEIQKKWLNALTAAASLGNDSPSTISIVDQMYRQWKETGKVPVQQPDGSDWPAEHSNANRAVLENLQKVLDYNGGDYRKATEWLLTKHPVSELNEVRARATNIPGKSTDMKYGSHAMSAKSGPFHLNMSGVPDEFTMDKWATRTWNRWMGTLVNKDGSINESPTPAQRRIAGQAFKELASKFNLETREAQAVLWFYEQRLYATHGVNIDQGVSYGDAAEDYVRGRNVQPGENAAAGEEAAGRGEDAANGPVRPADGQDQGKISPYADTSFNPEELARRIEQIPPRKVKGIFSEVSNPKDTGGLKLLNVNHTAAKVLSTFLGSDADWDGISIGPESMASTINLIRNAVDETSPKWQGFQKLAQDLAEATEHNGVAGVIVRKTGLSPEQAQFSLDEELWHAGQRAAGGGRFTVHTPDVIESLRENPLEQKVDQALQAKGYPEYSMTTLLEAEAKILAGDHAGVGLTPEEAQQLLFDHWQALMKAHPDGIQSPNEHAQRYAAAMKKVADAHAERIKQIESTQNQLPRPEAGRPVEQLPQPSETGNVAGRGAPADQGAGAVARRPVRGDEGAVNPQTETPEFKRWFGDSKVVDENGKPLVMWHGSPEKGFTEFDKTKVNKNDPDAPYTGFWFSSDRSDAARSGDFPWARPNTPGGGETRPFFLSLKNPVWRFGPEVRGALSEAQKIQETGDSRTVQQIVPEILKAKGYDGIVHEKYTSPSREEFERRGEVSLGKGTKERLVKNDEYGGVDLYNGKEHITGYTDFDDAINSLRHGTYVAFEPAQIKSSVGNRGTFDPNNPDTLARRPSPESTANGQPEKKNPRILADEKGNLRLDVSDYKPGPDLFNRLKFRTNNEEGKPVYDRQNILIHPDNLKDVNRSFADTSWFRQNPIMSGLLNVSGQAKRSLLSFFSPFHFNTEFLRGIQMGASVKEALHPGPLTEDRLVFNTKFAPKIVDPSSKSLYAEGVAQNTPLVHRIKWVGPAMKVFEDKLFGDYIPRLKADSFDRVVKQLGDRNPNWTQDQVHFAASKIVDAAFGGINWKQLGVSMNSQDLMRLVMLAPDFTGSQALFAKYGLDPGSGSVVRQSLGRIAMYNFGVARVLNLLTTQKLHLEHPFGVVSPDNKKVWSIRTMPEDIMHGLTDPRGFVANRLNPLIGRTGMELISGRDNRGKAVDAHQQLLDLLKNVTPIGAQNFIPAFKRPDETILEGIGRAAGANAQPNQTVAQKKAAELASNHAESGPVDPAQLEHHQTIMQLEDAIRSKQVPFSALNAAYVAGNISKLDARAIQNNIKETQGMDDQTARLYTRAARLPFPEFLNQIWAVATPVEKTALIPLLAKKKAAYMKEAMVKLTPQQRLNDPTIQKIMRLQPNQAVF